MKIGLDAPHTHTHKTYRLSPKFSCIVISAFHLTIGCNGFWPMKVHAKVRLLEFKATGLKLFSLQLTMYQLF